VKRFCQTLAVHVEQYFTFCNNPSHADFDPVYIAAMFLDPYLSQMLSELEEEEALDYLKTQVYLKDLRSPGTSASSAETGFSDPAGTSASDSMGTSTSASAGISTSASTGTSSSASGTSRSTDQQDDASPSLPKRLHLFKFVKMPEKQSSIPDRNSFDVRFRTDVERVRELFTPMR